MRSNGAVAEQRWVDADFARRAEPAEMPEWMDEPCSRAELTACLRDLAKVNRWTMSYRPTLEFLGRVARRNGEREIRIVDVGCGYGDMLRAVWRWARRRGVPVRLTGIDLHAETAEIAREATRAERISDDAIEWKAGDVTRAESLQSPDVVISSLVAHHLPHAEIVLLLRWMESSARMGWFINDLHRQPGPVRVYRVLARAMRWHRFVQHDGPVSFRRAFRESDWDDLLGEAGISGARVVEAFPARLCVERLR